MKKFLFLLLGAIFFGGCVSVDYTGQTFKATPESKDILYFRSRKELDLEKYAIIGRMVVTAPQKSDFYTFKKALIEKGRKCGGDAVCLVETDRVRSGVYDSSYEEFGAADAKTLPPPIDASQRGKRSPLTGERSYVVKKRVKALLLKERAALKKLME